MILDKKFILLEILFWLSLIVSIFLIYQSNNEQKIISISGETMGTTYSVKYLSGDDLEIKNKKIIEDILTDINQQMSHYIADSEISLFNSLNDTIWFDISEEFAYVVSSSYKYHNISNGLYDITIMPLVNLWGFGPEDFSNPPNQVAIDSVLNFIGQDLIEISKNKIRKKDPRVQIDLSSIAKGYAVDKILEYLNYEDIMVEIGGEVRVRSKNKFWKIGINTPSIENFNNDIEHIVTLDNSSLATSGNYRNFYIDENNFYHHEISPLSGYPIKSNLGSISVLTATSCMEADGLSTALYMMDMNEITNFFNNSDFEGLMIIANEDNSFDKIFSKNFPKD